jgi:hypothetical protein
MPLAWLTLVLAASALCASPRAAHAQFRGWRGGVSLTLDSHYGQVTENGTGDEREHLGSVGLALRAMASKSWLHYAAGLDYRLGATYPGGFLYDANLYPLGTGVLLGANARVGIMAGIGLSGVVDQVQFSAQAPVEAHIEFDLHRRVRIAAFARAIWLSDNSRENGSERFSFADEAIAGLSVRWGKRYYPHDNRLSAGNGYFLGVLYQEQLGSTVIGVTFGYSLNASMGRF